MAGKHTKFYVDKMNAKWLGVCAGIADYTGIDVTWVRVGTVLLTIAGGFPWTVIAYLAVNWLAPAKPIGLYANKEDQQFWQGVRQSPKRVTRDVRGRFRDIDRRLADIEHMYTARNRQLSDEIESLR